MSNASASALGFIIGLAVTLLVSLAIAWGSTSGDSFVRDGVRYGNVCDDTCGWYIIGPRVEFHPTPTIVEDE